MRKPTNSNQTGVEELTHVFPSPESILGLKGLCQLFSHWVLPQHGQKPFGTVQAIEQGTADLFFCFQPEKEIKKLKSLPGIGDWTAHYIAMRAMGWPDAFPHTDYGIKKALAPRTPKEILSLAEKWRPWRGYATINLWNTL